MASTKRLRRPRPPKKGLTNLVLDVNPNAAIYYVSHAEISHTPHDFGLAFGQLAPRLSTAEKEAALASGEVHLETAVQLIIPPTLIAGLIDALTTQKDRYEATFGPIRQSIDVPDGEEK